MNISNLLVALSIEGGKFLAGWGSDGFLKITVEPLPTSSGLVGEPITRVDSSSFVCSLVLGVESGQSSSKASRDAVLVIESNGFLQCSIGKRVTVSQIFGDYP